MQSANFKYRRLLCTQEDELYFNHLFFRANNLNPVFNPRDNLPLLEPCFAVTDLTGKALRYHVATRNERIETIDGVFHNRAFRPEAEEIFNLLYQEGILNHQNQRYLEATRTAETYTFNSPLETLEARNQKLESILREFTWLEEAKIIFQHSLCDVQIKVNSELWLFHFPYTSFPEDEEELSNETKSFLIEQDLPDREIKNLKTYLHSLLYLDPLFYQFLSFRYEITQGLISFI